MKTTAVALALAVGGLTAPVATPFSASDAEARHARWHGSTRVVRKNVRVKPNGNRIVNRRVVVRKPGVRVVNGRFFHDGRFFDQDEALAAGLIGFVAGAVVGGALSQPAVAAPVVVAPVVVAGVPEPYTAEWYAQCDVKYKSFDRASATYMGFDGKRHLCRLP